MLRKENMMNNSTLRAKLLGLGYGLISIIGSYIKNFGTSEAVKVDEEFFFVVDIKNKDTLKEDYWN